jgi:alpha-ribazole phosphatase
MRIDIIRHGECADNAFLRGQIDSPLTPLGEQQMRQAIKGLPKADLVFSSPAQRTLKFAQENFGQVDVLEGFRERSFGEWDGLSFQALQQRFPQQLDLYLQNPFADMIPQSESLTDFQQRIATAWQKLCEIDAQHLLVFSHSGVQRMLLKSILGFPNKYLFNLKIDYAARMTFEVQKTQQGYFTQLVEIRQNQKVS